MSRRGRSRLGLDPCMDGVEKIAGLCEQGLGTAAIQAQLSVRRSTISRVRALLRAAEARGYAKAVEDAGSAERAGDAFPKYSEKAS